MNETYIKLYRKILDNKKLMRDTTSFTVFIWLLLRVDYKTGSTDTGRFAIAQDLGINPNTVYSCLIRLSQNHKLINIKSNNRYSTISIVKWHRYQSNDNTYVNNKSTTNQQQINTIQEVKNIRSKEIYNERESLLSKDLINYFTDKYNLTERSVKGKLEELNNYCLAKGKTYKDYRAFADNAFRKDAGKLERRPAPPPPADEISDEQRKKNFNKLDEIRNGVIAKIGGM